jgi:hypothetical protein
MDLLPNNNNVSPLRLGGSALFRDKLLAKNLPPYNLEGQFSYAGTSGGYAIKLSDDSPKDTPNISDEVFLDALETMVVNKYGPATEIIDFANIVGNNAGLVSMQQQGLGTVQVPSTGQQTRMYKHPRSLHYRCAMNWLSLALALATNNCHGFAVKYATYRHNPDTNDQHEKCVFLAK